MLIDYGNKEGAAALIHGFLTIFYMEKILIINAQMVNEGNVTQQDILIDKGRIAKIGSDLQSNHAGRIIDAKGSFVFPGAIDDQVHFREPGLTHKATIYSESRAAVAGGVTSFMEMPNTIPNAVTQEILENKYQIAGQSSLANYSFFMGATNDNLEEVLKTDGEKICGIKIFMGSSTGNMLVDNLRTLEKIFGGTDLLIATHCEDEATIRKNMELFRQKYGEQVPFDMHPDIRSREACYKSSSLAVELAKKLGTKLHILHISTADELALFDSSRPLKEKKITAEACIHHLWFDRHDYEEKGAFIKWNPAVKEAADREALLQGLVDGKLDVLATDHAPHTLAEKQRSYFKAPSGGPLVQHSLVAAMELVKNGQISIELLVQKMCHNPAILFNIKDRGFIREGYFADLVLVNPDRRWKVDKSNILYKCGWSPFEGMEFSTSVTHTIVGGHLAYENGKFDDSRLGSRLLFDR